MKLLLDPCVAKTLVLVVLAGLSFLTMTLCSQPLRQAGLKSIIDLEVVTNLGKATKLWNDIGFCQESPPDAERKRLFVRHLDLDAWFIGCYAPLMCLLCWCAADAWGHASLGMFTFGRWLAAAQLLAGVLDFVENRGLRRIIESNTITKGSLWLTGTASQLKWLILIIGSIYLVLGLAIWVIHILRTKRREA